MSSRSGTTQKETYRDVLVLHIAKALEDTTTDGVAKVLGRRLRVDVTKVDSAVQTSRTGHTILSPSEADSTAREAKEDEGYESHPKCCESRVE